MSKPDRKERERRLRERKAGEAGEALQRLRAEPAALRRVDGQVSYERTHAVPARPTP